jgi:hypothetical protein
MKPSEWHSLLWRAVTDVAKRRRRFTTDDVWREMPRLGIRPESRALGSVLRQVAAKGDIEAVDEYVKSARPECHHRPIRVWVSKVCK